MKRTKPKICCLFMMRHPGTGKFVLGWTTDFDKRKQHFKTRFTRGWAVPYITDVSSRFEDWEFHVLKEVAPGDPVQRRVMGQLLLRVIDLTREEFPALVLNPVAVTRPSHEPAPGYDAAQLRSLSEGDRRVLSRLRRLADAQDG
jgi:hypothetical protein